MLGRLPAFKYAITLFKDNFQHASLGEERAKSTSHLARGTLSTRTFHGIARAILISTEPGFSRDRAGSPSNLLRKCVECSRIRAACSFVVVSPRRNSFLHASHRYSEREIVFFRVVSLNQNYIKKNDVYILRDACSLGIFFLFFYCYYFLIALLFKNFFFYGLYCNFFLLLIYNYI